MDYTLGLAIRFVVAGTVVVAISLAAEKLKSPLLAGILMMLPSITLVSVYFIGKSMGTAAAAGIVEYSLLTLPVWTAYAISLYYLLQHYDVVPAIIGSFLVFLAGSVIFVLVDTKLMSG